ncbi:MAG: flavodoxin, partial [Candidatus Margulisbacteria bacterium]|nr:flavodoxin [Candidatus Margulisiibacteriota bacterium]
ASSYVPAIKTFLARYPLKNKKIALYCSYEGDPGKTIKNLKKCLKNNNLLGEKGFKVAHKNKNMTEIKNWAMSLFS